MLSEPLVSVVIPMYNSSAYIQECLDSVKKQSYSNFEVIIVNDGSDDDSVAKCEEFLADPRFKLLNQNNAGPASAQNTGAKNANGEWLCFLGSDDLWENEKLSEMVKLINLHDDVGLIYSNGTEFYESGSENLFYRKESVFPKGRILERLLVRNCLWASSVAIKNELFSSAGCFDEDIIVGEDYLMWCKALLQGAKAYGINKPLVKYRKRKISVSSNPSDRASAYKDIEKVHNRLLTLATSEKHKKILKKSLARGRSDQVLAELKILNPKKASSFGKHLIRAWCQSPERIKPLVWSIQVFFPSGRKRVYGKICKKW